VTTEDSQASSFFVQSYEHFYRYTDKIFLLQWHVRKPDHSLVGYNSGRKMTKCVNNRCDVNYIGKFSNSYILGSIMNYKKATGFKVSGKYLLKSEKLAGKTRPGYNKLRRFKQF